MVQTTETTRGIEPQLENFERFEPKAKHPAWVFPLRKAGLARFAELGFPTLHDEDWRFTNIAPITRLPFKPVLDPAAPRVPADFVSSTTFGSLPACRLVFVNGHFAEELSTTPQDKGVIVQNLAAAMVEHEEELKRFLAAEAPDKSNPFLALNTAFFQDGAFVHIPRGKVIEQPIHLLFIATSQETGATFHPRNIILAGSRSQATVLETYVRTVDVAYFTNTMTELVLEEGAVLEHCKYQDEAPSAFHMASIVARLGRHSNLISHSFAMGAKLSRNNIRTHLGGQGVECILNGLYLTRDEQLADHHMIVEHAEPHCNSHEYFNGILEGRSKGVFHGRILVRQPAQKTDAKQTNKNLLLSNDATVDTKPQLEIYADDVKCTHGATVGQLNEEAIFYLRSRGVGAETARSMLVHAFAGEIIERIRYAPAREELDKLVWERLEANI